MPCPRHSMALYSRQCIVIAVRGLHQQRPTSPPTGICAPGCPGSLGQSLPSKPSTFGKQFGQDHTRSRFQKRLLVKHPASPLVFLPPSSASIDPLAAFRRKRFRPISGWSKSTCPGPVYRIADGHLTDVPDARVNMQRQQLKSFRPQPQRVHLIAADCHCRPTRCKARRLIMHMHANPALGTGYYSPRKLHPFQGVKEIATALAPFHLAHFPNALAYRAHP